MTRLLTEDAEKSGNAISDTFTLLINVSTFQQNPSLNNCAFCMIYNCKKIEMKLKDDDKKNFGNASMNGHKLFVHYTLKFKNTKSVLLII